MAMQKEFWPFSHYPMFSYKRHPKKFTVIKVILNSLEKSRELASYEELFPLGAQCTIKLLLDTSLVKAEFFSPNEVQSNYLTEMSNYYKSKFQNDSQSKIVSVQIYYEKYNYLNWREPQIQRKLLWEEKY